MTTVSLPAEAGPAATAPRDLAGLLAPIGVEEFLRETWGRTFQHVPGEPGKFTALLPWAVLNDILQQHRLEPPRLRLTREGKPIPAGNYVSFQSNRKRPTQHIPRLDATALTHELREGATLVLDAVDELCPGVTDVAEALESVFRVRVQVNAYAGWRTSHGFDVHWDDHDVFILQVAGRKDWKIFSRCQGEKDPPKTPVWEKRLEDGDLLYIPRGWWHVAKPLDEPTLHLTVGVTNPTGADLLTWFVNKLHSRKHLQKDLPLFAPKADQQVFADQLQSFLTQSWSTDILAEYWADQDAKARPRPRLQLPWGPMPEILPPDDVAFSVRWNGARKVELPAGDGEIEITAQGRRWRFAAAAWPVLARLTSGVPAPSEEIAAIVGPETARTFLRELVANGLVVVTTL